MDEKRPTVTIALAGSSNTGKSTIFNELTGMRQHTGNWHGKTTDIAYGNFTMNHQEYLLADLPGLLSPARLSEKERAAWDYLGSGNAQLIVLVCDASCLERELHLLRKILFLDSVKASGTPVILCLNFWDEAERKGIEIDVDLLQDVLQVPVMCCCALHGDSLDQLRQAVNETNGQHFFYDCLDYCPTQLAREIVRHSCCPCCQGSDLADRMIMEPAVGILTTFFLLFGLSWLALTGAFSFSTLLWKLFFGLEPKLAAAMAAFHSPPWLISMLIYSIYRSLAWIISLMLPCMTLFFFLFHLAEETGCLPRIAFQLDSAFRGCHTSCKQCLAMTMGFCCNAAAISQCRSMDSPREKTIAILTNSFVPCSKKLPALLLMISLIFMSGAFPSLPPGKWELFPGISSPVRVSLFSALLLCFIIFLAITASLAASWILSHTLLPGNSCTFALELPPYRRPKLPRTLIRTFRGQTVPAIKKAIFSTTVSVGIVWLLIHAFPSLFAYMIGLLEPIGRCMGLDGIILFAFLFSISSNETVLPVMLTAYLHASGTDSLNSPLLSMASPSALFSFLAAQGWTCTTILSMTIFCLFHWPCAATLCSIKKETGSWKWTAVSVLLPFLFGTGLCLLLTAILSAASTMPWN